MTVNNLGEVKRAFRNTFGKKGMLESDTDHMAEYMMSFFGFSDHVLDNRLASGDRDVFYVLEDEGFLTTTSEEVNIEKGKTWRLHYWVLKTDQIRRMGAIENDVLNPVECTSYEDISEDCWRRG